MFLCHSSMSVGSCNDDRLSHLVSFVSILLMSALCLFTGNSMELSVKCSTSAWRSHLFSLSLHGSFFAASYGSNIVSKLRRMTSIFLESVLLRSFSLKSCEHILGSLRVFNFSPALWRNTSHFLRSFCGKETEKNKRSGLLWVLLSHKAIAQYLTMV